MARAVRVVRVVVARVKSHLVPGPHRAAHRILHPSILQSFTSRCLWAVADVERMEDGRAQVVPHTKLAERRHAWASQGYLDHAPGMPELHTPAEGGRVGVHNLRHPEFRHALQGQRVLQAHAVRAGWQRRHPAQLGEGKGHGRQSSSHETPKLRRHLEGNGSRVRQGHLQDGPFGKARRNADSKWRGTISF